MQFCQTLAIRLSQTFVVYRTFYYHTSDYHDDTVLIQIFEGLNFAVLADSYKSDP